MADRSRGSTVVSASRCGRENLGSNPSRDMPRIRTVFIADLHGAESAQSDFGCKPCASAHPFCPPYLDFRAFLTAVSVLDNKSICL
jgi:hypothetical protein